jgi:hypothetical protein
VVRDAMKSNFPRRHKVSYFKFVSRHVRIDTLFTKKWHIQLEDLVVVSTRRYVVFYSNEDEYNA